MSTADLDVTPAARWAASGAMALTGAAAGPPRLVPWDIAGGMNRLARQLARRSSELGRAVNIDGPALLGERAALARFARQGRLTVGGGGRFVRAADGWVALQLTRNTDWELLDAFAGRAISTGDWAAVEGSVAAMSVVECVEHAQLLGLALAPCAALKPTSPRVDGPVGAPCSRTLDTLRVLDLSCLWAGPLCAQLLGLGGAKVTKVEDPRRPDGARRGPRPFYELLHGGHGLAELDFAGRRAGIELRRLINDADVVIDSSRPRVMERLGIEPMEIAAGGVIWVAITATGRSSLTSNTVGFGDDVAVGAGCWLPPTQTDAPPHFVADAIADPIAGLTAAVQVLDAIDGGSATVIDASLADSVAALLSPTDHGDTAVVQLRDRRWIVDDGVASTAVAAPRARVTLGS